jgi:SAM-dependent methyltransferase
MSEKDQTALFRDSWSLYDFITERNYMFHRELYAEVARLLAARRAPGGYRLLDLGCGNARYLAPCLQASPPDLYVGVDLSATALEEAARWLRFLSNKLLIHQDLLKAVTTADRTYEVIFTGFAIHHLSAEAKQQFFDAAADHLERGGELVMIDVLREPGQSRAEYLRSYIDFMRQSWIDLPSEPFAEARQHIEAYDFPEDAATLAAMAARAGLGKAEEVCRFGSHGLMRYRQA